MAVQDSLAIQGDRQFTLSGYPKSYRDIYIKSYQRGYQMALEEGHSEIYVERFAKGYAQGVRETQIKAATNLLKCLLTVEEISESTQLSLDEIAQVKQKLDSETRFEHADIVN